MFPAQSFPDPTIALTAPPPAAPSGSVRPTGGTRPAEALALLLAGNQRFVLGAPRYGHRRPASPGAAPTPFAAVVGCLDPRVPVEAVFDADVGTLCVVRSGGHVLDRAVQASVQFAVAELGVALVFVLGHSSCRAVEQAVDLVRAGRRASGPGQYLADEIAPSVVAADDRAAAVRATTREHVRRTAARLGETAHVAEAVRAGRVRVVGGVYDLATGSVDML